MGMRWEELLVSPAAAENAAMGKAKLARCTGGRSNWIWIILLCFFFDRIILLCGAEEVGWRWNWKKIDRRRRE
jgi:hypothetical protein